MATVVSPESELEQVVNVDNLDVTLEGARVLAQLYGYDAGGDNWDRLRTSAAGLVVDIAGAGAIDTELPAAALLADATANPTAPAVGSFLHGYNGADWDRLRSGIAQGLEVDVTQVQGNVAITHAALTELADAINANRMDVNIAASVALDVSAATVTVDSELPAAILAADNMAIPTAPFVLSALMAFDGATYDRLRIDSGSLLTVLRDAAARVITIPSTNADGQGAIADALLTQSRQYLFTGADFDRARTIAQPNTVAGRTIGSQAVGKTEGKVTYRVTFADLVGVVGVAVQIIGAAGSIVRVTRVQFSKPSVAQAPLIFTKNSAAATGGTSTTPTPVPLDSADAVAGAVVRLYTIAPTPGASVGNVYDADHDTSDVLYETFGDEQNTQGLVLRGVAEALTLVLQADATINGYIEFTEE